MLGSAIVLLPLALALRTPHNNIERIVRSKDAIIKLTLFAICGSFACQVCYMFAVSYTNSGTGTLLMQLNLILIMLWGCMKTRHLPTQLNVIAVIFAIFGLFLLITDGNFSSFSISGMGLFWGLLSAFAMASFTILPSKLMKQYDSISVTSLSMLIGAFLSCVALQPWNCMPAMTLQVIIGSLSSIVTGTILPYIFFLNGMKYVSPMMGGLLDVFEPVTAVAIGIIWFNNPLTFLGAIGVIFILSMIILVAYSKNDINQKQDDETQQKTMLST